MFEDTVMLLVHWIKKIHPAATVARVGTMTNVEGIQQTLESVGANFTQGVCGWLCANLFASRVQPPFLRACERCSTGRGCASNHQGEL